MKKSEIEEALERFRARTERRGPCLVWTGTLSGRGYGRVFAGGRYVAAHRFALLLIGVEIPPGKVVDHVCRNRTCVDAGHLRVVDSKTNTLENSIGPTAINARKVRCKRGHPLSGGNLIKRRGQSWRICKECQALYRRKYRRRVRARQALKEMEGE